MNQTTIAELIELVNRFRDERDWRQFHSPKDIAITLNLEAAEVLEHVQWKNGRELDEYLQQNKEAFADELADVLHSLLILVDDLKIDLGEAFKAKMIRNAQKYPVEKAGGSAKKHTQL